MSEYKKKHRWKDVGNNIKRCKRCRVAYCYSPSMFSGNIKLGFYKRYYEGQYARYDGNMVDYFCVRAEDFISEELSCTDGMILDIIS
jgi:hypothetical protein